jgi:hypothetical protein
MIYLVTQGADIVAITTDLKDAEAIAAYDYATETEGTIQPIEEE